jgi:hypothetical protein
MSQYRFKIGDTFRILYGTKRGTQGVVTQISSIQYKLTPGELPLYHTMYVTGRLGTNRKKGAWMFSSIELVKLNLNEHTKTL